jgi:uncharacterized protein (DUF1800 family)
MTTRSEHAFARFGMGRLGTEPAPADPRGWLLSQLAQPSGPAYDSPPSTATGLLAFREDRDKPRSAGTPSRAMQLFRAQGGAFLSHAITTQTPFHERLTWFWANHFTVSTRRASCVGVMGAYIEEAIRPHVLGRFEDMALAVTRHPAMLLYLTNTFSIGPTSPAARGHRGLNENLARECLELHTVSPAAGYTQADVTALARILTGWTLRLKGDDPGFQFQANMHEPGEHVVMGQRFPAGEEGGIAALRYLSTHPATYRFLATKLARHFVADDPPDSAIERLRRVLTDSNGDLGQVARALVALEAAWAEPGSKLRTPAEFLVASYRALGRPSSVAIDPLGGMRAMGQPLWTAPAPDGWADRAEAWATPDGMMRRLDWAYNFATRIGQADPVALAEAVLGAGLRAATRNAIALAGSRRDGFTVLLTSPEFQRR